MPKKFRKHYQSKPATTIHPSLASSTDRHGNSTATSAGNQSHAGVNETLNRLRISSARATHGNTEPHPDISPLTTPIRLIPQSQHQPAHLLEPRARFAARNLSRRFPGPAAPRSWRNPRPRGMNPPPTATELEARARAAHRRIDRLPGWDMPARDTLTYQLLKRFAVNWSHTACYEGSNLSYLPDHLKKSLLALLVIYGPPLVSMSDIQLMCYGDDEIAGATGVGAITHVHAALLCNPVEGKMRGYRELATFLLGRRYLDAQTRASDVEVPDSWEEEIDLDPAGLPEASKLNSQMPRIRPRFEALTHLDLAHAPFASWKHLTKDVTPHLSQLTHLSLAYWPAPSSTTNSRTTILTSASGSLDCRALNWYQNTDGDWSEAVFYLQRLGKQLPLLRWLDLEGCSSVGGWVDALRYDGKRHADWIGTFRGLETLIISQGKTPEPLQELGSMKEFIQEWVIMAIVVLRHRPSVANWLAENRRVAPIHRTSAYKDLPHRYQLCDTDVTQLWLWLEREHRVMKTASHIRRVRNGAGVPTHLDVVCSKRATWVESLILHRDRGVSVDENMDAGMETIRRILTPDIVHVIPDLFHLWPL